LCYSYKGDANIARIVYLHRIIDIRMSGSQQKNLKMFVSLCGKQAMRNAVIVTTMWGKLRGYQAEGETREAELKTVYWADMMHEGCSVERFEDTYASAWDIIGCFGKATSAENAYRAVAVEEGAAQMKKELSQASGEPKKSFFWWFSSIFRSRGRKR
jgi:hypothetical protein